MSDPHSHPEPTELAPSAAEEPAAQPALAPAGVEQASAGLSSGEPSREEIQAYIWARYVDFEAPERDLDEDRALETLENHYQTHDMGADAECFYYGILAFERSFARPKDQRALLRRALRAFLAYREQTESNFHWDIVDDRYHEAVEILTTPE